MIDLSKEFKINSEIACMVIETISKGENNDLLKDYFDAVIDQVNPDIVLFKTLIKCCVRLRKLDEALKQF